MAKSNRYDSTRQWYAIHTYSGYEEKVADSIKQRIEGVDMADKIFGVLVPKEKIASLVDELHVAFKSNLHLTTGELLPLQQDFQLMIEAQEQSHE